MLGTTLNSLTYSNYYNYAVEYYIAFKIWQHLTATLNKANN